MTKTTTTFFVFLLSAILNLLTAQRHYYWGNDTQQALELLPGKNFVLTTAATKETLAQTLAISPTAITAFRQLVVPKSIEKAGHTYEERDDLYWGVVSRPVTNLMQSPDIIYAAPFFLANGKETGLSSFFYVKLKQEEDYPALEKLARENRVAITGHSRFMPLWYILSCTKTVRWPCAGNGQSFL